MWKVIFNGEDGQPAQELVFGREPAVIHLIQINLALVGAGVQIEAYDPRWRDSVPWSVNRMW